MARRCRRRHRVAGRRRGPDPRRRRARAAPATRPGPGARARVDRAPLLMWRPAALAAALLLVDAAPPPLPDGNALVRRLVERQRHREELLDRYTYDLLAGREELDDGGAVRERHTRRYETFFVKGRPVRRLVEEDG